MKLVLCSEGIVAKEAVNEVERMVGKNRQDISVAIINEAYIPHIGDKRWVIDNLNSAAEYFGEIDLVNLAALDLTEVLDRIRIRDIIYVIGGKADYLMDTLIRSGLSEHLPSIVEEMVYVGSSAGSMVLGRRIQSDMGKELFGYNDSLGIYEYFGFYDYIVRPHLNREDHPNSTPEIIDKVSPLEQYPLLGMDDYCAFIIDGTNDYFVGSEPYIASNS